MIRLLNQIKSATVHALDGDIGTVTDCLLDEEKWVVRYLVIDVGAWIAGGRALISPASVTAFKADEARLDLSVDRARVKNSPKMDLTQPVTRRQEASCQEYYGFPPYWSGTGLWGIGPSPTGFATAAPGLGSAPPGGIGKPEPETPRRSRSNSSLAEQLEGEDRSHLRGARLLAGYHIEARDGEVGHIDDFLVDLETWAIDSILIDTSNLPGGKWVMVSREGISRIDWVKQQIVVKLTTDEIKNGPQYEEPASAPRF